MRSYSVTDIKRFTHLLFIGNTFDSFLLCEADFVVDAAFHIDGSINRDYYEEGTAPEERYVTWGSKKELCFQMIKGNKTPVSFKAVLRLSRENTRPTILSSNSRIDPDEDVNFCIIISFRSGRLTVSSGLSMNTFTMDKTLPEHWDRLVARFLSKNDIEYTSDL